MSEFESSFEDASAHDTSFPNMKWNGRTYVIQTSCSETESEADQDTAAMPRQSTPQSKSIDVTSKKDTSAAITPAIKKHLQPSKLSAAFRNKERKRDLSPVLFEEENEEVDKQISERRKRQSLE